MARKGGLGRGLGALLGDTPPDVVSGDGRPALRELPIDEVKPNPDQPRKTFDEAELEELASSIRDKGILQPIVVRAKDGGFQIVAGERRYQAARRAGLAEVPVVIREVSDEEVLQLALIENLQREDLNPIEEAMGYQSLMEQQGVTQAELGRLVSKSRSTVANSMRLLELPEDVLKMVSDGLLTAGHARAILSTKDPEDRSALARKVVDEGLSVRQTEILAPLFFGKNDEETTRSAPQPRNQETPKSYGNAARFLHSVLDTKVAVRTVRGKSRIEIEFEDEEQLVRLMGQLLGDDQSWNEDAPEEPSEDQNNEEWGEY